MDMVADMEVDKVADMVADIVANNNFTFLTKFHNFVKISQYSILMRELVTGVG